MAVTLVTKTMLKPKCPSISTPGKNLTCHDVARSASSLPAKDLVGSLTISNPCYKSIVQFLIERMSKAGVTFSMSSSCDSAVAAQQMADIAEGDNRGLALQLPIIPAILWALYNILGPAINQVKRMRSDKGIVIGLSLGGLVGSNLFFEQEASPSEIAMISEASSDYRSLLLLVAVLLLSCGCSIAFFNHL